jgi:DNA polymerase alpha-associated DNA helicase A
MEKLEKMTEAEYSSFMRVLFGLSSPSPLPADLSADSEVGKIEWIDPTLNDSQKEAIQFALASREVALIHGPPGVRLLTLADHVDPLLSFCFVPAPR